MKRKRNFSRIQKSTVWSLYHLLLQRQSIAKDAEGFLYVVSSLGVTGVRSEIKTDIGEIVSLVKSVSDIPCAVGFGISTPEQAASICGKADGIIVGSAIVKIIAKYGRDCVRYVGEYVKSMSDAVKSIK